MNILELDFNNPNDRKKYVDHMSKFSNDLLPKESEKESSKFYDYNMDRSETPAKYLVDLDKSKMTNISYEKLKEFDSLVSGMLKSGSFLTLKGSTGRGKTFYAVQILKKFAKLNSVLYYHDDSFAEDLSIDNDKEYRKDIIDRCCYAGCLLIDDFGEGEFDKTGRRAMKKILFERIENNRPIIFTTNCEDKDFIEMYGDRFLSRLKENDKGSLFIEYKNNGRDLRLED
jgi:DNA replication protein DnaC